MQFYFNNRLLNRRNLISDLHEGGLSHFYLIMLVLIYFQFAMKESSPAIHPSISSTVLGTMLINSVPDSVMITSSSILTPPNPLYSLILSTTKNLLSSGSELMSIVPRTVEE